MSNPSIYVINFFVTQHAQRERGKVIGVGVHVYVCGTITIDSPFQTFAVGLLVKFRKDYQIYSTPCSICPKDDACCRREIFTATLLLATALFSDSTKMSSAKNISSALNR